MNRANKTITEVNKNAIDLLGESVELGQLLVKREEGMVVANKRRKTGTQDLKVETECKYFSTLTL